MRIKLLSILLAFLLLTSVIIGFGCDGCGTTDKLNTGTYAFSLDDWDFFVKINTDSTGKQEHTNAVSQIPFSGTVEHRQGTTFENCYLKLKITVNENDYYQTIYLKSDGTVTFDFNVDIQPTYNTKVSYKVVETGGIVIEEPGFIEEFTFNNFVFNYHTSDDGQLYATLIGSPFSSIDSCNGNKLKTIYWKDYVYDEVGQKIRLSPRYIFNTNMGFGFGLSCASKPVPLKSIETIILDGDFYLEDFGISTRNSNNTASDFDYIKETYPNLKNIVITNIKTRSHTLSDFNLSLPESGVSFYINDHTNLFAQKLSETYFVNGIYSVDDFDIENYREEFGY